MQEFSISFKDGSTDHEATVVKYAINKPVKFVVSNVTPFNRKLPLSLAFISNPENDQLLCYSFTDANRNLIRTIGEAIFRACHSRKIKMHS